MKTLGNQDESVVVRVTEKEAEILKVWDLTSNDVIIIGAGASGSSAAFHLARRGKKVTLLEKEATKFLKPCGGGMAAAGQKLKDDFGILMEGGE